MTGQMGPGHDPGVRETSLAVELEAVGRDLIYPPTPDLVTPVRLALAAPRQPTGRVPLPGSLSAGPLRRSLVLALIVLALAGGIVAAAAFALGGLRIQFLQTLPSVPPETQPSGALGSNLGLGAATDIATAIGEARFRVFLPSDSTLAVPDVVYFGPQLAGGQLSLVYGPSAGRPPVTPTGVSILITEFEGGLRPEMAVKSVGPGTTVEVLEVNGGVAFWIEGSPHLIEYDLPNGDHNFDSIRLVRNALAWEQGGTVIRIEGELTRDQALALAAGFRIAASAQPTR